MVGMIAKQPESGIAKHRRMSWLCHFDARQVKDLPGTLHTLSQRS